MLVTCAFELRCFLRICGWGKRRFQQFKNTCMGENQWKRKQ